MKTWHRVIISVVVVMIVVIVIVLFMYGYLPRPFVHGGRYRAINQYEVFRDLLVVLLTIAGLFIALLGLTAYKLISRNLGTEVDEGIKTFDTKVKESIAGLDIKGRELSTKVKESIAGLDATVTTIVNEQVNYAMATFFLELSYDYWRIYEVEGKLQPDKSNELELAVGYSKKALRRAEHLDTAQRKYELILCFAANNLAYHLAAKNRAKDTEKAILWAKYAYERVEKYDFEDSSTWIETYAFVLLRMGNEEQKKEGQEIIKKLLGRSYIPKSLRDYIGIKYTEESTLGLNWS